jgi:uncharacterized protein YdeI (YjbR/CyaY-like superfamily)
MAKRPTQQLPDDVGAELVDRDLAVAFEARPFYQRNDYLSWIGRAVKPETRRKRIEQMLNELDQGGVYMGMAHPPSQRTTA